MNPPPPLRFLLLVVGGWIGLRAAMLLPDWAGGHEAPARATRTSGVREIPAPAPSPRASLANISRIEGAVRPAPAALLLPQPLRRAPSSEAMLSLAETAAPPALATAPSPTAVERLAAAAIPAFADPPSPSRRWSVSAWLLVRHDRGGATLAPGGTLGGSQAGVRVLRDLGSGFSLSARAYLPLQRPQGAEAAAGLDWRPVAGVPVNILVERRQAVGREGRSAFSVTAYGGFSRALPEGLRADGYGQAGLVGTRSRDAFVDASLRVVRPWHRLELGGAVWGAAQPGVSRLDAGPSLSWRLPVPGAHLRLEADWRFRLAGDAAPRSGPALVVAADF